MRMGMGHKMDFHLRGNFDGRFERNFVEDGRGDCGRSFSGN